MLVDCLQSVSSMEIPINWRVETLIIDNSEIFSSSVVREISQDFPLPIRCVHEPEPGIPFARNRALIECSKHNYDWVAFIDDDETIDRSWLKAMNAAYEQSHADVLHGETKSSYQGDEVPRWPIKLKKRKRPALQEMDTAGTDNVMFKSRLISEDGLKLRFDENMRFSGGSDRDFFYRAHDLGARIVWVPDAKTYETLPASRQTFWHQVNRAQSVAANECYISKKRHGLSRTIGQKGGKAIGRLLGGLLCFPIGIAALASNNRAIRLAFLNASKNISYAIGTVRGLMKTPPQRYIKIHGQ